VDAIVAERFARHGLAARDAAGVVEAARLTTAIQAQDAPQSRLGLRARGAAFTEADVLDAVAAGTVVRTWLMRGTVHLVDADDVRWLTALFGPALQRRFAKRWRDLGLVPGTLDPIVTALPAILAAGPLTRGEIVAELRERGLVPDSTDPQAVATHILLFATSVGLLCRATDVRRDARFTLLDPWTKRRPDGPRGDDALAEIARRYFAAFAPATAADFTAWSGLPSTRAIGLIRDELDTVDIDGRTGFRPAGDTVEVSRGATVRLAPAWDNYLVGYADRRFLLDDSLRPEVYVGGLIKPTVLHNGRVVATWRLTRSAKANEVSVVPLQDLSAAVRRGIAAEVRDLGRYLGVAVTLAVG
jgi:hypothetical protein